MCVTVVQIKCLDLLMQHFEAVQCMTTGKIILTNYIEIVSIARQEHESNSSLYWTQQPTISSLSRKEMKEMKSGNADQIMACKRKLGKKKKKTMPPTHHYIILWHVLQSAGGHLSFPEKQWYTRWSGTVLSVSHHSQVAASLSSGDVTTLTPIRNQPVQR